MVDSDFLKAFPRSARGRIIEEVYVTEVVRKEVGIDSASSRLCRRVKVCKPRESVVLAKLGSQGQRGHTGLRERLSGPDWTVLLAADCLIKTSPRPRGGTDAAPPFVLLTGEPRIADVAGMDFHLANLQVKSPRVQDRRWFFVSNAAGIAVVERLVQESHLPFPLP